MRCNAFKNLGSGETVVNIRESVLVAVVRGTEKVEPGIQTQLLEWQSEVQFCNEVAVGFCNQSFRNQSPGLISESSLLLTRKSESRRGAPHAVALK